MTDQTPDPIDVSLVRVISEAVGGMLGHGPEPEIAKVALEALKAAGLQVTPILDAGMIQEVETLIAAIRAMRPDPSDPCPPGWDADDREGDRNIYRAAELLAVAYLPPPRLTDASYSGRTYK